jgi:uncharacterized protein YdeI (YjbR/CyaY-like superfamily)
MRFRTTLLSNGKTATGIQVPDEVAVPPDLMAAFARDRRAATFFDTLTPSQKQWYVLPIEQAKAAATRERRVAKALAMLRDGRKR